MFSTRANHPPAISALLKDTDTSFGSDIKIKQSVIDQTQALLQDEVAQRDAARAELAQLEAQRDLQRTLTRQRNNLRWAITEARTYLANAGVAADADPDADWPYDPARVPAAGYVPGADPEADAYVATLPPPEALRATLAATREQNRRLEERVTRARLTTVGFEELARKIVALGTQQRAEEGGAGGRAKIEKLIAAIESEEGSAVDLGRVRDFLRRVDSDET